MHKRTICLLLALALCAGAFPVSAAAYGETGKSGQYSVISASYIHSAFIDGDGNLYTCGSNDYGQLGVGDVLARTEPTKVQGLSNVVSVSTGHFHTAAITSDGSVYTWGYNGNGRLGLGHEDVVLKPEKVAGVSGVIAVGAGYDYTAALTADGSVYTWGARPYVLGQGDIRNNSIPTKLDIPEQIVAISCGPTNFAAVSASGALYTWGDNSSGSLGHGDSDPRSLPEKVGGISNVAAVSMGQSTCAAITSDGSLYVWGANNYGQLGLGDRAARSTPERVETLSKVVSVSMGYESSLAITADGTAYIWGCRSSGQLGLGDASGNVYTPAVLSVLGEITAASLGFDYSIILTSDGLAYSFGANGYGQLGLGDTAQRYIPECFFSRSGAAFVFLDEDSYNMTPGETISIGYEVLPSNAASASLTWKSSAPGVVSVSGSGKATAVSNGTAVITATTVNGQKSASCKITVFDDGEISAEGALASRTYITAINYSSGSSPYLSQWASAGGKKDFVSGGLFYVAYETGDFLKITAFDGDMSPVRSLIIEMELDLFGAAAGDGDGNIYVLYGQSVVEEAKDEVNVKLVKYDGVTGAKLGVTDYIAGDGYFNGTRFPFSFSNASVAVSGNVVAMHFGRGMFMSGDGLNHQSSTVLYADKNTMKPLVYPLIYVSHSFDQQVIATKDGGFLFIDHGDAYPRAFRLSYTSATSETSSYSNRTNCTFETFHFKQAEGGSHAYNYTFATLGGIAETDSAYVLVANSEKTLEGSSPTGGDEPRDVFIQILKKDFWKYDNDEDRYLVSGEVRTREQSSGYAYATTDYGVIWLTSLARGQNAMTPMVVALDGDRVAVFWELYEGGEYASTYYTVLMAKTGKILKQTTKLPGARLSKYDRPVYLNGKISWTVTEAGTPGAVTVYTLDVYSDPLPGWDNPFTDVDSGDWFGSYVEFIYENGLMTGTSQEHFSPNATLTRGMVATVLYRLSGSPDVGYESIFTDVPQNEWYSKAVVWAYKNDVVNGYGNGLFGPKDEITREQLATMLHRYEVLTGMDSGARADLSWYRDSGNISSWSLDSICWAVGEGLISGMTATTLVPGGTATRAQCAAILTRYLSRI